MTESMGDERLARLNADNEPRGDHLSGLTADEVGRLLDEVKRLCDVETKREAYVERLERSNATAAQMNGALARRLAEIGKTRLEFGYRFPSGYGDPDEYGYDDEATARRIAAHGDTIMRRRVGDWEVVPGA